MLEHPRPAERGTSIAGACDYLGRVLRRRAVVFLISDFFDDSYARALRDLARRHEVLAVTIVDPLDEQLPDAGIVEIEGIEGGDRALVDTSDRGVRRRYAEASTRRREARREALRAAGVDEIELRTDGEAAQPLLTYFRARGSGVAPRRAVGRAALPRAAARRW